MPPQKKGRKNNKKKGRNAPSSQSAAAERRDDTDTSTNPMLMGEPPEYEQRTAPGLDNFMTIYMRYKDATKRFYDFMIDQTPEGVRGKPCVNALVSAADWMKEQQLPMPKSILKDLKLAIRSRSRVATSVFGGGDEGHKHFLSVLTYCWTVLSVLPRSDSVHEIQEEGIEAETRDANRFGPLDGDFDEEDEEEVEYLPSFPVSRPEPQPQPLTLEELFGAEDRHDACLFLLTLDHLMRYVTVRYADVVTNRMLHSKKPELLLVQNILEAAVAANMAIQQVQALEMVFQEQHPHLSTPYRTIWSIAMPEVTQQVKDILDIHSVKHCSTHQTIAFLGDCLECAFRRHSETLNQIESVVNKFCTEFEVDAEGTTQLKALLAHLDEMVLMEVPLGTAEKEEAVRLKGLDGSGGSSNSWLSDLKSIGGDHAIHHTIRVLQWLGVEILGNPNNRQLDSQASLLGQSPWNPGRSQPTGDDLDALILSHILADWIRACSMGFLSGSPLPLANELHPLFVTLREFAHSQGKRVTWSIAFAMHAILASTLEMDSIFDEVAEIQYLAFTDYFNKVELAVEVLNTREGDFGSISIIKIPGVLRALQHFGHEVSDRRARWNPLCGGTVLSYVTYIGNLQVGHELVDCFGQLRITLHLFNAFLVNDLIQPGQVPFLDVLHRLFRSNRGVWEGPLPERGQLLQRFCICFGMNPSDAKRLAEQVRRGFQGRKAPQFARLLTDGKLSPSPRKLKPIDPARLSTSFRRICMRDLPDEHHTPKQPGFNDDAFASCVRASHITRAMREEHDLLSLNLPSCGAFLEKFVGLLTDLLVPRLPPTRDTLLRNNRQILLVAFVRNVLGALDFADSLPTPIVARSVCLMTTNLGQVHATDVHWFPPQNGF